MAMAEQEDWYAGLGLVATGREDWPRVQVFRTTVADRCVVVIERRRAGKATLYGAVVPTHEAVSVARELGSTESLDAATGVFRPLHLNDGIAWSPEVLQDAFSDDGMPALELFGAITDPIIDAIPDTTSRAMSARNASRVDLMRKALAGRTALLGF